MERKSLRVGAAVILGAVILRLIGNLLPQTPSQQLASWLIFGETGRRLQQQVLPTTEYIVLQTQTTGATEPEARVCFSVSDTQLVRLHQTSSAQLDLEALLSRPLSWDLRNGSVSVLIIHTHACESYADSGSYRTEDVQQNMVSIGSAVAKQLEAAGIGVIHDTTLHDKDSYNDAYDGARQTVSKWLTEYPDICLVLDLHRDAIEDQNGNQLGATVEAQNLRSAQLMPVVGTGYSWQENAQWQENMALGLKLYVQLEKMMPGICRPLCVRSSRYNQDLSPGMLLWEVGTAGNTHSEALTAAQFLAQAIITLANGTEEMT